MGESALEGIAMKNLFANKSFSVGFTLLSFFAGFFLLSFLITPFGYNQVFEGQTLLPMQSPYFLGTDDLGRDLFSRILIGSRLSLGIGLLVGLLSVLIGASLGLIAGYFKGRTDYWTCQVMNALQALPSLLLALFVVAILGQSLLNTIISVTLVSIPVMFRLVRTAAIVEAQKDYIVSAQALGASPLRILKSHLLPNCMTPILVQTAVCCSEAILNTAALGFLGLGVPAPYPEWGTMLSDARNLIETAPRLMILPGTCLLLLILGMQLISDGLRDQLDPKLRNRS